jgi:aspartyl-tRNA(Asn)/glutamyl-tRNA(Gln) amidotransferase subunit B
MDCETIIGLEVHAQLLTKSKMFCRCGADYINAAPNARVCPVCLGMPGVLPVINKLALEYAVMTALALNCTIPDYAKFDRKNYPYPDLMKGYQISQYDAPFGINGWIDIEVEDKEKDREGNKRKRKISITRVHLEEDTAKLIHRNTAEGESYSLVDVNRAGSPLMEIVSEPDLRSPEEARQYLMKLRTILQFLGVSSGNMEEGSFRCDANISMRVAGSTDSVKVEVKNMNSFKSVFSALTYEEKRQREAIEAGDRLVQETRGWIDDRGITVSQRSKEYAHDYRYFPEPDLPPMVFSRQWVADLKSRLPELPEARRDRYVTDYGLSLYDASLLTASKSMADFFEACIELSTEARTEKRAKVVSNWLLGEFTRLLNVTDIEIDKSRVTPTLLVDMLELIDNGTLGGPAAKTVFEEIFNSGRCASDIIAERGLSQISDAGEIEGIVDRVIASNGQAVEDYKKGREQALQFLVGQVMRETKGRADYIMVNELIKERLVI